MSFHEYGPFEARFRDEFDALGDEFPLSLMVFEAELRNLRYGHTTVAQRNLQRRGRRVQAFELLARCAAPLISNEKQVFIDLPSFKSLSADLSDRFGRAGFGCLAERRVLGFRVKKLMRQLATRGPSFGQMARALAAGSAEEFGADHRRLQRLEAELVRNYRVFLKFLRAQDIRLFLADGDTLPTQRFMCRSACDLGIPFVVLAHGYIGHPALLSVAPIRADKLLVWTRRQRDLIAEAVPERQNDIVNVGFPPRYEPLDRSNVERRVLFAWEPLAYKDLRHLHPSFLGVLARSCRMSGFTPVFRPHPKERQSSLIEELIATLGFERDEDSMHHALERAALVVSSNSTALTEASMAGVPTIQIAELARFEYEEVPQVRVAEFDPEAIIRRAIAKPQIEPMDSSALFDLLLNLVTD